MKKILCISIAFVLLFTAFSASAYSPLMPDASSGDVDFSRDVTIQDATLIQKYTAGLEELSKAQLYVGDVNDDGEVNIKDATLTQKVVACLEFFEHYKYYYNTIGALEIYPTYESGKAVTNTPITFYTTVSSLNENPEVMYEFSVDGEVVQTSSEDELTYTFDTAGEYKISLKIWDKFGNKDDCTLKYTVKENISTDDELLISAFYISDYPVIDTNNDFDWEYIAFADKGAGDYLYRFLLEGEVVQDFSENNRLSMNESDIYEHLGSILTVQVKDSSTADSYVSTDLVISEPTIKENP